MGMGHQAHTPLARTPSAKASRAEQSLFTCVSLVSDTAGVHEEILDGANEQVETQNCIQVGNILVLQGVRNVDYMEGFSLTCNM